MPPPEYQPWLGAGAHRGLRLPTAAPWLLGWNSLPWTQSTRWLWSLAWGDIPFSGLSVPVCGGRKGEAPDSQAVAIPEGAWFSLIPGPVCGALRECGVSV